MILFIVILSIGTLILGNLTFNLIKLYEKKYTSTVLTRTLKVFFSPAIMLIYYISGLSAIEHKGFWGSSLKLFLSYLAAPIALYFVLLIIGLLWEALYYIKYGARYPKD